MPVLALALAFVPPCPAQTELGSADDLTVLGVNGTAADPDVEIKGFSVFGATQAAYAGLEPAPGNVVVNGVLAVSSGAYFAGSSTFTAAGKIYVGDGAAGQVLGRSAAGYLLWTGSDNLGNHIATTTLQMGVYGVNSSSSINAAHYQIDGSTVLALTASQRSTAVGVGAGRINTGNDNVFFGYNAGYNNTTGGRHVVIGSEAGLSLSTNVDGTFVGYQAGKNSTTGGTFFGSQAGLANTTGGSNTFLGYASGLKNTVGYSNVFAGESAGGENTGGDYNTFIGLRAGGQNTTADYNTALGGYAAYQNRTGSNNAVFGYSAGYGVAANSYSNNSLFGYYAGYGLSTGSNNILMGYRAGAALITGANNIVIGYEQEASNPAAAGELNIGGVLFGNLTAKTIGISTRAPQAALDIVSTGTAADQMAQLWRASDGVIQASMSATGVMMAARFIGDGSGLSGIGGTLSGGQVPRLAYWTAGNTLGSASITQDAGGLTVVGSSFTVQGGAFSVGGSTLTVAGGNVGVGVAAPAYKFEVQDTGALSFQVQPQPGHISLRVNGSEVARLKP